MGVALDELQAREWPPFRDEQIDGVMATHGRPEWVTREIVVEYLERFVNDECPGCGWGRFTWGIAHGSGFCAGPECGWPGTLYHFIAKPGVEVGSDEYYATRFRFEGLLWAHPREVSRR